MMYDNNDDIDDESIWKHAGRISVCAKTSDKITSRDANPCCDTFSI